MKHCRYCGIEIPNGTPHFSTEGMVFCSANEWELYTSNPFIAATTHGVGEQLTLELDQDEEVQ